MPVDLGTSSTTWVTRQTVSEMCEKEGIANFTFPFMSILPHSPVFSNVVD